MLIPKLVLFITWLLSQDVATRTYYGRVTGSKGHGHHRLAELQFCHLIDKQYNTDETIDIGYKTEGNGNATGLRIALMYLQSDTDVEEDTPTNIIITPNGSVIEASKSQQFTATVLPSDLAVSFPVTWSVSDNTLGSIDGSGLYNKDGIQTVIANISSGLVATATLTQHIFLNSITIGSIPSFIEENSYNIVITYSPSNYTEPVHASTSDNTVAEFSSDGTLIANGAGTATITLTGAYSGKITSKTVTVTPKVVTEKYLQINKSLSEIRDGGTQKQARDNLGLGDLATKDSLNANDVGALPVIGDFLDDTINLDDVIDNGIHNQNVSSNATFANNYSVEEAGSLIVVKNGVDVTSRRQTYLPYNSTSEFRRYGFGNPIVWSSWDEK